MGSFLRVLERTRDRFRARLRVLIGLGGICVSNREANGLNGRQSQIIDSPKDHHEAVCAARMSGQRTTEGRVCPRGNLVARGNWTKICPFANQKPLPYFPNASMNGSFMAMRRCSRTVWSGTNVACHPLVSSSIARRMAGKNLLPSLFAPFCKRPVQQRPHDCWHNTRLS